MDLSEVLITIASLKTISEEEKSQLEGVVQQLHETFQRQDFKLRRIEKDKSIVVNILNATIGDLERKQRLINEANEQLLIQKEMIEENAILLKNSIQKLERSYKELEQFSYIASHDLRSPLRTISSFAQLIKKRYYTSLDKDGVEFIDYIVKGVFEMDRVIQALLDYAKVDHQEDTFAPICIGEVIEVVQDNLHKQITKHKARIIYKDLPTIYGNRTGLIQLFQNLIANAIKFKSEQDPVIVISSQKEGDKCFFELRDNGIGIDEEFREKVFTPFQQLDKQQSKGVGIGLSICRKVVKMHQGDISIAPPSSQGTTFVFTLSNQEDSMKEPIS